MNVVIANNQYSTLNTQYSNIADAPNPLCRGHLIEKLFIDYCLLIIVY